MANKKFLLGMLAITLVFGLMATGCRTTVPILYTDNPSKEYTILGEVTYNGQVSYGYTELLRVAKAKYPNCDYVIDVMIDRTTTKFLFFVISRGYTMRGTAIMYNE